MNRLLSCVVGCLRFWPKKKCLVFHVKQPC